VDMHGLRIVVPFGYGKIRRRKQATFLLSIEDNSDRLANLELNQFGIVARFLRKIIR